MVLFMTKRTFCSVVRINNLLVFIGLFDSHDIICRRFTMADIHRRAQIDENNQRNLHIDGFVVSVVYVSLFVLVF
jgi:hypothetical protein